ncbi:MAG: CsgG/HfaB family protein [Spirochaetota bacterium]
MRKAILLGIMFAALGLAQDGMPSDKIIWLDNGDVARGPVKDVDADTIKMKTDFGVLTIPKKRIKRMIDLVQPKQDEVAPVRKTGRTITTEAQLVQNLLRFIPGSLAGIDKTGIRSVAIQKVNVSGAFDINDKAFEAQFMQMLSRYGRFVVLERQALDILLKEQQLSLTGAGGEEKIGKLIGVDALITIDIEVQSEGLITASVKMTHVERAVVIWEDEFKGELYGTFKLGFRGGYGLPNDVICQPYIWGGGTTVTFPAPTGHFFELGFTLGQMLSEPLGAFELSMIFTVGIDLFRPSTVPVVITNNGVLKRFTPQPAMESLVFPLVLKVHLSEFFNSSYDIVRLYVGGGLYVGSWPYKSESSATNLINWQPMQGVDNGILMFGGAAMALVGGIEVSPIRDISLFAEVIYLPFPISAGETADDRVFIQNMRMRAGIIYYLFK